MILGFAGFALRMQRRRARQHRHRLLGLPSEPEMVDRGTRRRAAQRRVELRRQHQPRLAPRPPTLAGSPDAGPRVRLFRRDLFAALPPRDVAVARPHHRNPPSRRHRPRPSGLVACPCRTDVAQCDAVGRRRSRPRCRHAVSRRADRLARRQLLSRRYRGDRRTPDRSVGAARTAAAVWSARWRSVCASPSCRCSSISWSWR